MDTQTECLQCGTCCTSGGPALHSEDRRYVSDGSLPLAQLITIRKGELAHNPLSNSLQPIKNELVKISGGGRDWNCFYFDPREKGCTIYQKRPQACKALKCWDTKDIEELIEVDTLTRLDLIEAGDPIRAVVVAHEKLFPCPDMRELLENGAAGREAELEALVNEEIGYRTAAVGSFGLSLGEELFYFGRPLFHLFLSIGAEVREVGDQRLAIRWPAKCP